MANFFSRYLDDLIVPVAIIISALAVGILIERLIARSIYRAFEKRNWRIGRRLIRSFNGIITLWFGLAAFRAELTELPLKASALPIAVKVSSALLILSFAILLGRIVVAFVRTFSSENDRAVSSISLIENIIRGFVYVLGVLAIFRTFGVAVTPILTALGVGGLAVALALQDTLSNFFAGIYIILSRSLDPGDYIKLASGEEGVIRDIAWRVTTLRTPGNTLIIVPNNKFATSIIVNYDRPEKYTNLVLPFTLDATTDLKEFEAASIEVGRDVARDVPGVIDAEPIFEYVSIANTGVSVQLTLQISDYLHQTRIRNEVLRRLYEKVHLIPAPKPALPKLETKKENEPAKDADES